MRNNIISLTEIFFNFCLFSVVWLQFWTKSKLLSKANFFIHQLIYSLRVKTDNKWLNIPKKFGLNKKYESNFFHKRLLQQQYERGRSANIMSKSSFLMMMMMMGFFICRGFNEKKIQKKNRFVFATGNKCGFSLKNKNKFNFFVSKN